MTWSSRLGDNLASRWSGRGSTYSRGNFISLSWPFWFCLFVCLFPPPIGWFQIILIAVVFTFQMKIPNKNRKRNEIYQVDQWRSLKTEKSLGTTLQSGFSSGHIRRIVLSSVFNLRAKCSHWKQKHLQATLLGELQLLTHVLWFKVNVEIIYISF